MVTTCVKIYASQMFGGDFNEFLYRYETSIFCIKQIENIFDSWEVQFSVFHANFTRYHFAGRGHDSINNNNHGAKTDVAGYLTYL